MLTVEGEGLVAVLTQAVCQAFKQGAGLVVTLFLLFLVLVLLWLTVLILPVLFNPGT